MIRPARFGAACVIFLASTGPLTDGENRSTSGFNLADAAPERPESLADPLDPTLAKAYSTDGSRRAKTAPKHRDFRTTPRSLPAGSFEID